MELARDFRTGLAPLLHPPGERERGREGGREGGMEGEREGVREGEKGGEGRKEREEREKEGERDSKQKIVLVHINIAYAHVHNMTTCTCITDVSQVSHSTSLPRFVPSLCLQSLDLWLDVVELCVETVLGHLCPVDLMLQLVVTVALEPKPPPQDLVVL